MALPQDSEVVVHFFTLEDEPPKRDEGFGGSELMVRGVGSRVPGVKVQGLASSLAHAVPARSCLRSEFEGEDVEGGLAGWTGKRFILCLTQLCRKAGLSRSIHEMVLTS